MEFPLFPLEKFQLFLVCLARIAGMVAAMPALGGGIGPAKVKLGLTLMLSLLVFPVVEPHLGTIEFAAVSLALLVVSEAILGAMAGFVSQLILASVEFGGAIISMKMGLAAATLVDPANNAQTSLISRFLNVIALLIFLALDFHLMFIRAVLESFRIVKPGSLDFSGGAIPYLMELTSHAFVMGIKFSAPVLALLIISSVVLGLMSRVFPQLNVFLISFPINIGLGLLIMGLTMSLFASLVAREFGEMGSRIIDLMRAL